MAKGNIYIGQTLIILLMSGRKKVSRKKKTTTLSLPCLMPPKLKRAF